MPALQPTATTALLEERQLDLGGAGDALGGAGQVVGGGVQIGIASAGGGVGTGIASAGGAIETVANAPNEIGGAIVDKQMDSFGQSMLTTLKNYYWIALLAVGFILAIIAFRYLFRKHMERKREMSEGNGEK